jgi:hypothetical protein
MRQTNVHFTNTKFYECEYCYKDFIPKRRNIQIYCSNSCRSKAYHKRKKIEKLHVGLNKITVPTVEKEKTKIEELSLAGAGNAALGVLAVKGFSYLLTSELNKNATKGDIQQILNNQKRYHLILEYPSSVDGKKPYFDLHTKKICYFFEGNVIVN